LSGASTYQVVLINHGVAAKPTLIFSSMVILFYKSGTNRFLAAGSATYKTDDALLESTGNNMEH